LKPIGNELKIGLTVFVAVIVGIIGYRFMLDTPLFRQSMQYYTIVERVDGIGTGSFVYTRGINVGSVQRMELLPNDSVMVHFSANVDGGVPVGTIVYIRSVDLLEKAMVLEKGISTERIPQGGFVQGVFDEGVMGHLRDLSEDAGSNVLESTERLNRILGEVDRVMIEGGSEDLQNILDNLDATTAQVNLLLARSSRGIESSIAHLNNIMANVDSLSAGQKDRIDTLITNLESVSGELDSMTKELNSFSIELNSVMRKINEGEGSLGKLVNDPSLYNNLDSLSYQLNRMIKELNDNPRHFLRHMRLIDIF
jgi:phospholipid/cholesterol/gamma-HCH transport system substrate-binding protein